MQNVFVYGTLLSPELVKKLTGKSFESFPAVLHGYKRLCVKPGDYPAIIQNNNSETDGLIIINVDSKSLELLSFYEGNEYRKKEVTVLSRDKSIPATTFVWASDFDFLEDKIWDFKYFEKNFLEDYLKL